MHLMFMVNTIICSVPANLTIILIKKNLKSTLDFRLFFANLHTVHTEYKPTIGHILAK